MNEYDLDILRLHTQGFCCAQIIVQMALEMQGVENPGWCGPCPGCALGLLRPRAPAGP
jgi:hypothetical protein